MVEFKIKTIAEQDTSIDKSNPDLYDGGSGFITVGDKAEPKLGLFRFKIAEKPNFGAAALKYGQMGFYNVSTSNYSGTNLPHYSIYKMKTSPDGLDWGAGGSINPVKRGKIITGASTSTNYITVEEHQLKTGEPITWTPFVRFYGDAILTGITREVEYYAIRIDDFTIQVASTVALAMAGTAVSITTATPVTFTDTNVRPNINEDRYGYIRSRKYRSDIHLVSSWADNYESISENFDGSTRRESELDFQPIQRQIIRKDDPYLKGNDTANQMTNTRSTTGNKASVSLSQTKVNTTYGTKQTDGTYRIYLKSNKTLADGGGWWRVDHGDDDRMYIQKRTPWGSSTPNPDVHYEGEIMTGTERYGDEVTPLNSIFHTVRGAREFQQAAAEEGGENDLQATGAIRFSSEKKLTGGQSCNFYNFWKMDSIGVAYTSTDGKMTEKFNDLNKGQECMTQYKNLPCPTATMNAGIPTEWVGYEGAGQLPIGSGDTLQLFDAQTATLKITMNLAKLAKAFTVPTVTSGISTAQDDIILSRRSMFVCLAETPVGKGETLYQYITRLGGRGTADSGSAIANWADNTHITQNTTGNLSAVGFWIVNTSIGIQVFPLCNDLNKTADYGVNGNNYNTYIDSGNQEFWVKDIENSTAAVGDINTDLAVVGTDVSEDEWAEWNIRISPAVPVPTLHITSSDDLELAPSAGADTTETKEKNGIPLYNIKQTKLPFVQTDVNTTTHVFTITGHGLENGDAIFYDNAASGSVGFLTDVTTYYVGDKTTNTFKLYTDRNTQTLKTFSADGNDLQFFLVDDVGRLAHDPTTWTKNLSIWTCNAQSNYSVNTTGNPDDYLHGDEDADMESNIFIDNISFNGVNVSHQNNTRIPDASGYSPSPITISSSHATNATFEDEPGLHNTAGLHFSSNKSSKEKIEKVSNNIISLGFEDPSQISSYYKSKKSWRYLYWQGYSSSNLASDGPIAWSAGNTLPLNTYLETSSGTNHERDWFSPVDKHSLSTARYDQIHSETWYHDAGSPFTHAPEMSLVNSLGNLVFTSHTAAVKGATSSSTAVIVDTHAGSVGIEVGDTVTGTGVDAGVTVAALVMGSGADIGFQNNIVLSSAQTLADDVVLTFVQGAKNRTSLAWETSYSDAHVSLGAQFSNEALHHRNLYFNRTTVEVLDEKLGGAGTGQRMFTAMPGIGVLFRGVSDVFGTGSISIYRGSFGETEHNWNDGHKVVYWNNGNDSVGSLVSCDNTFRDTPVAYYVVRAAAGNLKLAANYDDATHASPTIISLDVSTSGEGLHALYDYDYYVNRKFWMDGWASKGVSRLMLQPTLNDSTLMIKGNYIDNKGNGGYGGAVGADTDVEATATKLYLTKRENIQSSAKVLEVAQRTTTSGGITAKSQAGTITLTIDTTDCIHSTPGTTYRAYLIARGSITAGTLAEGGYNFGEDDTDNYKSGLTIQITDSNNIEISNWDGFGSTGTKDLLSDDNICDLWIGPEKYWIYFKITNKTGDTEGTYRPLPNKTYDSVCVVSPHGGTSTYDADIEAWGTPGATYNESIANFETIAGIPSAYKNRWHPEPSLNKTETIFDLQDYGFGAAAKSEEGDNLAINGIRGGNVASFVPRDTQINYVNMLKVFDTGESKVEGDYLDLALSAEDLSVDSTLIMSSSDNISLPLPFLLTVFEDEKPANPTKFKVSPNTKDAFFPEFSWSAADADLWYGFIIIDDKPIDNQYHSSILHVPLDEDLRNVASNYDNNKGWYYSSSSDPAIYGYRYYNTSLLDIDRRPLNKLDASIWSSNFALKDSSTAKTTAKEVKLYDNVEGLGGNTKYFDKDGGSYVEFPFNTTASTGAAASAFTYPRDEMSVVVHVSPNSWADSDEKAYIASFNESTDTTANFDAWGIYLDEEGRVNAFVGTEPDTTTPNDDGTEHIQLKATTKLPIDGTPTSIILTVDSQIHQGNVKLFINGRLEDQSGLRGTLSKNNWPTDSTGLGGDAIFFDTDSTTAGLFIGAKAQNGSQVGQSPFNGKIEEFVWYDKTIFPVVPQNNKFTLEKPLEELVSGSTTSSSKSHTARLFIKDYHNIRGKTTGEVAASSQVSFKKAAFELYT